jgi:ubiquinone/menaquinone biosynthesis C-methylase UbiE
MEKYSIRGGLEGYQRLQVLARALWPTTSVLLARAGLRPGMRCLDLGCGGGEVTFELARIAGDAGHATGFDMDETKLALGREAAATKGIGNIEFRAANVNEWDEPDAYDLIYCRFLLTHLGRPVELLRKMWAALKPGGAMVVEDIDFNGYFCHPANEGFNFYVETYRRVVERRGGDADIGPKLYGYFLEAGIPNVNLSLIQFVDVRGEAKTLSLSTLENIVPAILEEGIATEDEVKAALENFARFTEDPTTIVGSPRVFQLWCGR